MPLTRSSTSSGLSQLGPQEERATALGRPTAIVGNTVPINLVAPGQVWGDGGNAFDMRFAKILRFGRTRNTIGIDIYNRTNSAAIPTYNQSLNPAATTGS